MLSDLHYQLQQLLTHVSEYRTQDCKNNDFNSNDAKPKTQNKCDVLSIILQSLYPDTCPSIGARPGLKWTL